MVIEYDGTDFFGWQYQPGKRTVQGEIEDALRKITNEHMKITGAGRTDHGVHALGQVANFHSASNLEPEAMKRAINSLTGNDIYIKDVDVVEENFNSRYSAKAKLYQYHIIYEPSPFKMRYNLFVKHKLNVMRAKDVIPYLLGEHDFQNFSAEDEKENKICKIFNINLTESNSHIIIAIEGERFLRKMVRGIVGFLYDIGRGRFFPRSTKDIFHSQIKDIYFVPPHGLFLVEVKY